MIKPSQNVKPVNNTSMTAFPSTVRINSIFCGIPIRALLLLLFFCPSVAVAEDIFLSDKPLSESQTLMKIGLYSEDKVMGQNNIAIKLLESELSIGRNIISFLPPMKKQSQIISLAPNRTKRDLYLIRIPFTLHELPEKKHYQKVMFQVELDNKDVVAFDLLPKDVLSKEQVTRAYTISPQIKFQGIEGSLGEFDNKITFETLTPVITAFGEGENRFYWIYSFQHDQFVLAGTKYAVIILDVPIGMTNISGKIHCEAEIVQQFFGENVSKQAKINDYPIQWDLRDAKHLQK